jgi:hypothetical protein
MIGSTVPAVVFLLSVPVALVAPQLAILLWLLNVPIGWLLGHRMPAEARADYER